MMMRARGDYFAAGWRGEMHDYDADGGASARDAFLLISSACSNAAGQPPPRDIAAAIAVIAYARCGHTAGTRRDWESTFDSEAISLRASIFAFAASAPICQIRYYRPRRLIEGTATRRAAAGACHFSLLLCGEC